MRIAQIAPIAERVPPRKYGGTERIIYALTEELVQRGHEVTLFATGNSTTSAKLASVFPRGLREARFKNVYGPNVWAMLHVGAAYARQEEFTIIHDHNDYWSLPLANIATTPVVMTMHGSFNIENRKIYQTLKRPHIVTISNAQAVVPDLNYAGTVYNGLPMDYYPFSNEHDGYLLFVGRISMEKGVHHAVEIARILGLPLIIAAKLEHTDRLYYQEYIEPYLSDDIRWIGEVHEEERNKLMSRAMAFLHPVTWREPFGLTLIESMACGCPAIAFDKGSIPEIVVHGKTGFVVRDTEGMLDAVLNITTIDRAECRRHALEQFSAKKMADSYEAIYKKILTGAL